MKIIVESNIPYIKGLLEPFGSVTYIPSSHIDAQAVKDADAIFVRTRTKCNSNLLAGSKVKFIATATIGLDHIDLDYCRQAGIYATNAPGCNAPAVAQYVFATIGHYFKNRIDGLTLGVIGVGNVGSIVARWGKRLGMRVLECDPPRQRREGGEFCDLDTIAHEADIVTFHTPLTTAGPDPTFHLADSGFFAKLRRCRLFINCSRGEVADTAAVTEAIESGKIDAAAIDCWENEPVIDLNLLGKAFFATPHIAGYSTEGKMRATAMTLQAFERHFGVKIDGIPTIAAPEKGADITDIAQVTDSYNPLTDTIALKESPATFELQRDGYALRKEVVL